MKNDDYWANRAKNERDWIDKNIKNDKEFDKVLEQHYSKLTDDIMDKINKEYISLGKNNGYTMADAMAKVKAIDVEKFGKTAKDLVDQAHELYKKNGKVGYYNFTDRTNKALRLYNATMRINRLEMLKAQIGEDVVQNGININSEINDKLKNDAIDEFKRQSGILDKNRAKPDVKEITKIVSAQTGDVTFSDRIWQDQASLKAELDVLLTRQMVRGISPIEIARDLKKLVSSKVDSARYAAERIARTESARVQTQVQLASFDKYDINYCHWIAEPTACQICTDISENNDGMGEGIYSTTEVPFLPAHPNCRCSLSAYEPDEAQLESKGKKTDQSDNRKEPEQSFDRNSVESMRDYLKSQHGIDYDAKIPTEYLANMVDFLDEFNDNHPEFAKQRVAKLNAIKSEKYSAKRQNVLATTVVPDANSTWNNYITFNEKYLQEKDTLYNAINRGIKQNWNQPEDPAVGLFAHEYGHSVARNLMTNYAKKNDYDKTTEFFSDKFYNDFFNQVSKEAGGKAFATDKRRLKELQSKGFVSIYGQSSKSEMFAEQFANAYTKSESDSLNNSFKTVLERWLKEYK